jgi:hypothetical protein
MVNPDHRKNNDFSSINGRSNTNMTPYNMTPTISNLKWENSNNINSNKKYDFTSNKKQD